MTTSYAHPIPLRTPMRSTRLKQAHRRRPAWKILTLLCCLTTTAAADQAGNFSYTEFGSNVTISGYAVDAPVDVTIPATIVTSLDPFEEKPVTGIESGAFQDRIELTSVTIPAGVTHIDALAFSNCEKITSVTLPPTLSDIGSYAFYNCLALPHITIPSSVANIGRSAFGYCIALTEMPLPEGVTTIGIEAFSRCTAMTSVTIPPTVTTLGIGAFSYCSGLTSLTIPSSVISISNGAFSSCSGLTNVTLPDTLISIGTSAFQYCSGLTSVTLPSSLTTIGSSAFANCRGLTGITIPSGVKTIGSKVLMECSTLTSISVSVDNTEFSSSDGILFNKDQTVLLQYPAGRSGSFTIPSTATGIGALAFARCNKLTSVEIPSSVESLGNQAFSTCGTLTKATFLGDAPIVGFGVFELEPLGFTIYYQVGKTGFGSEPWTDYGYPVVTPGSLSPINIWLTVNGLPSTSAMQSDDNGDGVNLLTAYALNLDPNQNLSGSLPKPAIDAGQMSLTFYSGAAGVTYNVESSGDLQTWNSEGVTITEPDANQMRTATVDASSSSRFLRLVVSY